MTKLLDVFFLFGAFGPLPSIVLYVFFPADTVEFFGGHASPTANFWCCTNAASDATISFLCFSALCSRSVQVKQLVVRAFAVYAVFHWGSFLWWSIHGDAQHPASMVFGYPVSIVISLTAVLYWGWLRPPQVAMSQTEYYENVNDCADQL